MSARRHISIGALDREELAWAAGFFDGEGCTAIDPRPRAPTVRMSVTQAVDPGREDQPPAALLRWHRAVGGMGAIYITSEKRSEAHRTRYVWCAASLEHVQAILALLWHWLSPVKRAQAQLRFKQAAELWRDQRHPYRDPSTLACRFCGKARRMHGPRLACRSCEYARLKARRAARKETHHS